MNEIQMKCSDDVFILYINGETTNDTYFFFAVFADIDVVAQIDEWYIGDDE